MMVNVTEENYYTDTGHMSVSQYKALLKCQGGRIDDKEKTPALLVGSYVDSYIEGTLDKFKEEHPEIYSSRGTNKGELKSDFKIAQKVCDYLDNDDLAKMFLSGEKQTIMTGQISNVPFKIKMDSYLPSKSIVDLKVMATIRRKNGKLYNFIKEWGYDLQLACYQEIVKQNTGEQLPCYIVVATKETPIECRVVQIPQRELDLQLELVKSNIEDLYKVLISEKEPIYCGKCPKCIKEQRYNKLITTDDLEEVEENFN